MQGPATQMGRSLVDRLEEGAIAVLLAAMTLVTLVQVILRYVFNTTMLWGIEGSTYLFGWLVLIGVSYGVKVGSHIGVDALVNRLPVRGRRVAGVIAGLLCITYAGLMLVGSWNYFLTVYEIGVTGDDIPIQRWIMIIILPVGFLLLLYRLVQMTVRIVRGEETGFRLANEAADAIEAVQAPAQETQRAGS
jgi:C4-dicarboxylate transporter DctQ subunit